MITVAEFCGKIDLSILQFVFSITDDIHEKITQKKLFYKEQIIRYVQKQIDDFFKSHHLKSALLHTYKYEMYNTIMFKLKGAINVF